VKLPPQLAAVVRGPGAWTSGPPPAAAVLPLKQPTGNMLEGHPDTDYVQGVKSKVTRIYCAAGNYWAYCSGTGGYECCPKNQKCGKVGNDWTCV
jgi:hypothetical protein